MTRARLARLGVCAAIAAAAVPTLGVGPAHACSCVGLSDAGYFKSAGAVFTASLVDEDVPNDTGFSGDPVIYSFAVDRVYKGTVTDPQRIVSVVSGATCGLELKGDGPFVIFTNRRDDTVLRDSLPAEYADVISASLCGGTRSVKASETLPFGRGRAPAPASTASPTSDAPDFLGPTSDEEDEGNSSGTAAAVGIAAAALIAGGFVLRRQGRK